MKPKPANSDSASHAPSRNSTKPKATRPAARQSDSPYAGESNLREICGATARLQTFSSAIDSAGLAALLEGNDLLTIFAPTDRAFAKLPTTELSALLGDRTRLAAVLQHHMVVGRVRAPREQRPRAATPRFGAELQLTSGVEGYHVDEAKIVRTNIRASNGVIHAIDTVLLPR